MYSLLILGLSTTYLKHIKQITEERIPLNSILLFEIRKNCKIFNFLDSFEFNLIWAQEKIKMFLKQQIKEEKESCIMF